MSHVVQITAETNKIWSHIILCLCHQTLYKLCLVFYYFYILDFIFAFAVTVPYLAYSEKPVGGKQADHYNLS